MGTETILHYFLLISKYLVEKMGPLRGDGNSAFVFAFVLFDYVEKMGPLRGDGNKCTPVFSRNLGTVEKMGPLRGDGN